MTRQSATGIVAIAAMFWLLLGGVAAGQAYTTADLLTVSSATVGAGDDVTLTGGGFAAGTTVDVVLIQSGPAQGVRFAQVETDLGSTTADADGKISIVVTIPDDFSGDGMIVARGQGADGADLELSVTIENGRVQELPFTGTSSTSRWLVGVGLASIIAGGGMLLLRNWRRAGVS